MKRKIALILAGCLAFSPVSAGLYPSQAHAAEAETISEIPEQTPIVITVKDENDVTLTESGEVSSPLSSNRDPIFPSFLNGAARPPISSPLMMKA